MTNNVNETLATFLLYLCLLIYRLPVDISDCETPESLHVEWVRPPTPLRGPRGSSVVQVPTPSPYDLFRVLDTLGLVRRDRPRTVQPRLSTTPRSRPPGTRLHSR